MEESEVMTAEQIGDWLTKLYHDMCGEGSDEQEP